MVSKATEKRPVIERIFQSKPKDAAGRLIDAAVTQGDITNALRWCKIHAPPITLSEGNPANFFKDIIRRDDADRFWPDSIFKAGYSARQIAGQKRVFEFVPVLPGQTTPFPNPYMPSAATPRARIQSVSMTIASKTLGRKDEPWMTQVLVRLNVIPSHFALYSPRRSNVLHVDHLQMGVKRKGAEIDAIFMGVERLGTGQALSLITFEAKQRGERLIAEQIERQAQEAINMTRPTKRGRIVSPPFQWIIPCGIKSLGNSEVYLIEFDAIPRDATAIKLTKAAEMIYQIEPPVPGLE